MAIERVTVLGAGVMGAGIAAHISNAGIPVRLLDIVPEGAEDRNAIARGAVEKLRKARPSGFMEQRNARLISVGNLADNLADLADSDWIIEAVIERLDIKRDLYAQVDAVRKPGSIVSSNTSTIPLAALVADLPISFRQDFLITHFFNPPRFMRLLEVVGGADTRPDALSLVGEFCDVRLGKGVVPCKDTPGFIGNRIGIYWLQCAVLEAIAMGITVEEADAVMGAPVGIPKTGVFGLMDLVGIDLMPHVLSSMATHLPADDPFGEYFQIPPLIDRMIANGYTGRKGKGGFYRLNKVEGKRVKEALDLDTGTYRTSVKPKLEAVASAKRDGLRGLVDSDENAAVYARRVLVRTLAYAASLVPEISDDVVAVDTAMRLGFNWKYGPFELIDRLGADWLINQLTESGRNVPPLLAGVGKSGFYREHGNKQEVFSVAGDYQALQRPRGVLLLADIKIAGTPIAENPSASLWDVGDGVVVLEFHSKMNAIDADTMAMIRLAIEVIPGQYRALVIYNEAPNFSVGANLGLVMMAVNTAAWDQIDALIGGGQQTYKALKYAPFPVVGAPVGMALGGGCEVLLHCDALQAHAETYMGLVEVGVGLIPGWGGCKELLQRWYGSEQRPGGPMPPVVQTFETISMAQVAQSAGEGRRFQFLRARDRITMNRDRVLADAKQLALELVADYAPPIETPVHLPGRSAQVALRMAVDGFAKSGKATPYDVVVGDALAQVLSGGDTDITEELDEDALLTLERRAFMGLIRRPATIARIEHMLETGKPLRN